MGSETRFTPQRTPRSTGIAQTQMVNRPATMGTGGLTPPVTASPAASAAIRAQATGMAHASAASAVSPAAAQTRTRASDARVELRDNRTRHRGTLLPGPPGTAVQSVELLPNVTKSPAAVAVATSRMIPERRPLFSSDEILLLVHLVDTFEGGENTSEENKELARGLRDKIAALVPPPTSPSVI